MHKLHSLLSLRPSLPLLIRSRRVGFTASKPLDGSPSEQESVLKAPGWGLPLPENVLGTLTTLYCDVGSRVFQDEVVAIVETDKLAVDIKATHSGVIRARLASEGEDIKIWQPLYSIDPDAAQPAQGSEEWQRERQWARAHEQKVDEDRAEADRLWREHRKQQQAEGGSGGGEWRWQSTAREQQFGGGGGKEQWWQWQQQHRQRQYRHEHPRGHQWRQRAPSWPAAASSRRAQPITESTDLLAMPLAELVPRVLRYHASDPWLCLGLRPGASKAAIRKRYLALAMRLHPDRATPPHPARLNEAFGAMDEAFKALRSRR